MFYKYTLLSTTILLVTMGSASAKHLLTSDKAMATNNVSAVTIIENENNAKAKARTNAPASPAKITVTAPIKKDKK